MTKNAASKLLEAPEPAHPNGKLEEKYEQLQQDYRNVCLERDLLRKAIKLYSKHRLNGIDTN